MRMRAGRQYVSNDGRRRFHRLRLGPLLLLAALLLFTGKGSAEVSKEYQIKAAYLYNFTKFVEWSPQHFKSADSPILIGILRKNPFGDELAKIVQDRKVNGREIRIIILNSIKDANTVQVLFIGQGEEKNFSRDLLLLQKSGVLTVGETRKFTELGGMITFAVIADKVRFEINQGTAEESGIRISSQLLKLASFVHR